MTRLSTMIAQPVLLLVFLCLWQELGGAASVFKMVRHKSHVQVIELNNEMEQNEKSLVNLKDLTHHGQSAEVVLRAHNLGREEIEEKSIQFLENNKASVQSELLRHDDDDEQSKQDIVPLQTEGTEDSLQTRVTPDSSLKNGLTPGATSQTRVASDSIPQTRVTPNSPPETKVTPDSNPQTKVTSGSSCQTGVTVDDIAGAGDDGLTGEVVALSTVPLDSTDRNINTADVRLLKLQPDSGVDRAETGSEVTGVSEPDSGSGWGLVFQQAVEGQDPRSRSRRSWIWNQFFVIEEYSGPEPVLIGRLASSIDRGDGHTKYILKGEGAGSVFVIDGKTGNIHVTKPLDREEKDQYRLIATVTDRQTGRALEPSSQFIIRVQDINDNPPVFQDVPYSATVPEMANIGTSVIQVTATDADDPTYGNSARLVYSLLQGQQYFSVDPQTGVLRTAVPDMDREAQDPYLVVLQARDMGGHQGGLTGTTTITVRLGDVNDNPPRFTQSVWSFSVSELAMPGVEVGRLSATDADLGENARMDFTIVDGDGWGDTFNITGLNQEAVILLNKVVDYERRSAYSLSVEVQNPTVDARFLRRGPFKDRATVRVTVLNADEPPRFSRPRYRLDVSENCPATCTVGRITAVDPDTGQSNNIRYSIDPDSDPEALFRIAPDNGLITTAMELDREREQWHNITVIATQRDNPSQVTRVAVAIETLDLNDNAPELDRQYTTAMCDSSTPGQVVQVLRAIDKDQGHDSPVHFSIPTESNTALNFTIRERGGPTASLVLLSSLKPLPRSASSSLFTVTIPIVLRDGASDLSSTGTVTITVCPCLRGAMWAEERKKQMEGAGDGERVGQSAADWERETVCLPMPSSSPLLGFSSAAMLAILACATTLLVVAGLSLSLRRQKRDTLSPVDDDEIRENIIAYDDEGGGEADTAAFDIAALKSAPQSARRAQRALDSRNMYSQQNLDSSRMYSWAEPPSLDPRRPGSAPLYGRFCYSIHALPALRDRLATLESGLDLADLACEFPGGQAADRSLAAQSRGTFGPLEPGVGPAEPRGSRDGSEHRGADGSVDSNPKESEGGDEETSGSQNLNRDQSELSDRAVILTCSNQSGSSDNNSSSSAGRRGTSPHRINTRTSSSTVTYTTDDSHSEKNADDGNPHVNGSQQDMSYRTMEGTLCRGSGGIPLTGTTCLYPEASGLLGVYALAGRDFAPQLVMPLPGQVLAYGGRWALGRGILDGRGGANSLTLRMGDFLRHRLAQVTFDPSQPPYDSVQTYRLEGGGSQAGSLSSLESEGEREGEREGGGIEEWGPKFHKLVEILRERERERGEENMAEEKGDVKREEGKKRAEEEGEQEEKMSEEKGEMNREEEERAKEEGEQEEKRAEDEGEMESEAGECTLGVAVKKGEEGKPDDEGKTDGS